MIIASTYMGIGTPNAEILMTRTRVSRDTLIPSDGKNTSHFSRAKQPE